MKWFEKPKEETPTPDNKPPENQPSIADVLARMDEMAKGFTTSTEALKGSIEQTNTRLQSIEEGRRPKPTAEPVKIPSVAYPGQEMEDEEKKAFITLLTPFQQQAVELKAMILEREALDEVRDQGWGEFLPQIKEAIKDCPLEIKAKDYAGYIRNVADMIIGRESRKNGLKRKNSSFVLEDATSNADNTQGRLADEDREWLNYQTPKVNGKPSVTRKEFLERVGVAVQKDGKLVMSHDLSDPATLAAAKKTWSSMTPWTDAVVQ
jgi:hypothetical protein